MTRERTKQRIVSPLRRESYRNFNFLSVVLVTVLVGLVILTFAEYGINSDEVTHIDHGRSILRYYASLFGLDATVDFRDFYRQDFYSNNLHRYGGLFDATAALADRLFPLHTIATMHLMNALVGLLGIVGCWKLARWLSGPRTAFFAGLLLVLVPAYYGHMFNNPKDIPFAAAYVWSLYYLVRVMGCLPRVSWHLSVKMGLVAGACMSIRMGGLLLLAYMGLLVAGRLVVAIKQNCGLRELTHEAGSMTINFLLPAGLIAYVVMCVFWPWAQANPLIRPFQALNFVTTRSLDYMPVLFEGQVYTADDLPPIYVARYMLMQFPDLMLFLLATSPVVGIIAWLRSRACGERPNAAAWLLVAIAAVFPLAYAAASGAPVYNAYRHFLFVVPPMACVAGATLSFIIGVLERSSKGLRVIVLIMFNVYFLYHVMVMVRLHPYQYVYYNAMTGGIRGAWGNYELDYYCHSYAEGVRWLEAMLRSQHGEAFEKKQFVVFTSDHPFSSTPFFPSNFVYTAEIHAAEFVISKDESIPGDILFTIDRFGVPLNYVKAREVERGRGKERRAF